MQHDKTISISLIVVLFLLFSVVACTGVRLSSPRHPINQRTGRHTAMRGVDREHVVHHADDETEQARNVGVTHLPDVHREVPRVIFRDDRPSLTIPSTEVGYVGQPVTGSPIAVPVLAHAGRAVLASHDEQAEILSIRPTEEAVDHRVSPQSMSPTERGSSQLSMAAALQVATLVAANSDRALDEANLAGLNLNQQALVRHYHQLVMALQDELASGGELDPQTIATRVEQIVDHQPIRIRTAKLCLRVRGYGDYDEYSENRFLAGRQNAFVLYVEVDRYKIHQRPTGMNEVSLRQEVVLYTDPGGTAVWKQPSVQIVDVSRNRRRDFFITQLLSVPPALSVGKYVLKVSVQDQHGKTVDEEEACFEIVADSKLLADETR